MEWISIKDRMPEESVEVLLFYHDIYGQDIGTWNGLKYSNGGWHTWKHGNSHIETIWENGKPTGKEILNAQPTHWTPLPDPPEVT